VSQDIIPAGGKHLDAVPRKRVLDAMRDPRPSVPAATVFRRLRSRRAKGMKAAKRGG
jgi:antitoxin ParD1/3/4